MITWMEAWICAGRDNTGMGEGGGEKFHLFRSIRDSSGKALLVGLFSYSRIPHLVIFFLMLDKTGDLN
jgi:hypothetical protein